MADQDPTHIEEHSDIRLNEGQRKIPFDAASNRYWAESATEKESRTSKINPLPTWGGLVSGGYAFFC
jgi:hypothetical protein